MNTVNTCVNLNIWSQSTVSVRVPLSTPFLGVDRGLFGLIVTVWLSLPCTETLDSCSVFVARFFNDLFKEAKSKAIGIKMKKKKET